MFDLEKFKTGNYYVHLPTQELYDEVMDFLDDNGFVWASSLASLKTEPCWFDEKEDTVIRADNKGVRYSDEQYYKDIGYKKLELNKEENMNIILRGDLIKERLGLNEQEENMEEKIRRDLIKMLFEKEFNVLLDLGFIMQYEGRVVTNSPCNTAEFIDFIDKLNSDYGISGKEVAKVVIESFDVKEYEL